MRKLCVLLYFWRVELLLLLWRFMWVQPWTRVILLFLLNLAGVLFLSSSGVYFAIMVISG